MKQEVNLDSTQFQPKNEYLLIKPEELKTEKTSSGGIVYSLGNNQSSLKRPTYGKVIAVGKDIDDITEEDYVLWPGTDGLDIEFNDGDFLLLRYKSVIGKRR